MKARTKLITRLLAISTLFAVVLTASVPFYCSTGWCCSKHQAEQKQAKEAPSCCAETAAPQTIQATDEGDCCGGGGIKATEESKPIADNSCNGGCATGCCKIAASSFVLTSAMSISILHPVSLLIPASALDTGIELTDYIPQPPRVLTA